MDKINLIGAAAAVCTTVSFLPQVWRIHRTRRTHDLSLPTYVIFSFGVFMWLCYGIMTESLPMIIANGLTFLFGLYIVAMKLKYK